MSDINIDLNDKELQSDFIKNNKTKNIVIEKSLVKIYFFLFE